MKVASSGTSGSFVEGWLDMIPVTLASTSAEDRWLSDFHAGGRAVMEEVYRQHFAAVERSVGAILDGADRDTVVHELFLRLLSSEPMRRGFTGGSLAGWLRTSARNLAIDFQRRRKREASEPVDEPAGAPWSEEVEARILVDRFRREVLPAKWAAVFEARFLRELDQRAAARAVGIHRTTLVYQEMRIRALLRSFLLEDAT
jgi:RNA polymerase sigma-70 factor (ECF subfamily)